MSVKEKRRILWDAAIQFGQYQSMETAAELEAASDALTLAKMHARDRREAWKERRARKEKDMSDGIANCRIEGCSRRATHRPTLLFPAADGGNEPIRLETFMLDVCEEHSRTVGPDAFTGPTSWASMSRVWTDAGLPVPDPSLADVEYAPIRQIA